MSVPLTPAFRRIACQSRLFATLPPDLRAPLLDAARVTHYDRGAPIFHQGDTALSLHIVAEGWVKLYRIAPSGAEAVVGTINLDYRSLYLHLECAAWMAGIPAVKDVHDDFLKTEKVSMAMNESNIGKLTWGRKIFLSVLRSFAPLM